jgi:5'-3' exonuclease
LSHAALPTLDVNEGALDKIFAIYKELLPVMGGYLTHAGELNAGRLELLLQQLALLELETLEQRAAVSTSTAWHYCLHMQSCHARIPVRSSLHPETVLSQP